MANFWVLVADSARARIFKATTPSSGLEEVKDIAHPEALMQEQDLTSDAPGKNSNHTGSGHHAMDTTESAKKHESKQFARIVSHELDSGRNRNEFANLIIVAAPSFLGLLREQLSSESIKSITLELDKNLTQKKPDEIRNHLPTYLPHEPA